MVSSVLLPSQPSFFTLLSFPSDPPGWLVCCCATSAHSLQEMTNRVKDKRHPLCALMIIYVISLVSFLSQPQSKIDYLSTSSTVWLTKAVDTAVSLLVHVVVYTVPSLRRPPVLLVQGAIHMRGDHTPCSELQDCVGDAVGSLKTIHSTLVAESMGGADSSQATED